MSFITTSITLRKLDPIEKQNLLRPFLRWVGGKQKLIANLLQYLPPEEHINRYYEPFLGGGSLFFAKKFQPAILGDLNSELIQTYSRIKENPEAVYRSLLHLGRQFLEEGEPFYYQQREIFNQHISKESFAQAARFIFLNHTSFNGYYRVNKAGRYNTPFGKRYKPNLPSLPHLRRISAALQAASLHSGVFYEDLIAGAGEGDFIYLDPPYPVEGNEKGFPGYTIDRFGSSEQKKLAELAMAKAEEGAYVMISNVKSDLIGKLYARKYGWHEVKGLTMKRQMGSKNSRVTVEELVITNYKK